MVSGLKDETPFVYDMNFIDRQILNTNVKPETETWQSRSGKDYFWDKNVASFQMALLSLYLSQKRNDV